METDFCKKKKRIEMVKSIARKSKCKYYYTHIERIIYEILGRVRIFLYQKDLTGTHCDKPGSCRKS